MKLERFKYTIVLFMLSIFVVQGIVTVAPLFSFDNIAWIQDELLMNTTEERSSEKEAEKSGSAKEFLHQYSYDCIMVPSCSLPEAKTLLAPQHHTKDVFLPINTPPPRYIG